MTKITIICSDPKHPIFNLLENWCNDNSSSLKANLVNDISDIEGSGGEILFLISCSQIIPAHVRKRFNHSLVIHASDLPNGRGWSPHIWQILDGANKLTVTLLEAEDRVDTGKIWKQEIIKLDGTELYDEINEILFDAELKLLSWACKNYDNVSPKEQTKKNTTYYPKRTPKDSEIDITASIKSQFNLLRVSDHQRFPAFFKLNGRCYKIKLESYEK